MTAYTPADQAAARAVAARAGQGSLERLLGRLGALAAEMAAVLAAARAGRR